jgi:hypothetical protein
VSAATGSVTLTAPQDIHTGAAPTFAGLTLNGSATMATSTGLTNAAGTSYFHVDRNPNAQWLTKTGGGAYIDADSFFIRSNAGVTRFTSDGAITMAGTFYGNGVSVSQNNTTSSPGLSYTSNTFFAVSRSAATCIVANTQTTAGGTINPYTIQTGATLQGGLAMTTAGVVSVAAFAGMHWSQLQEGVERFDIPFATVLETVDELCFWPGDDMVEDRLCRFKVSDTPGSNSVYGVFIDYNDFGEDADMYPNDANIMSLGAYFVRISAGEVVQCGDYIESNGDGCGRVQTDNVMRASTIAKVTSTIRHSTSEDGSYVVPCTLHCG